MMIRFIVTIPANVPAPSLPTSQVLDIIVCHKRRLPTGDDGFEVAYEYRVHPSMRETFLRAVAPLIQDKTILQCDEQELEQSPPSEAQQ